MAVDLRTQIAGVEIEHPIFNASGPECRRLEELKAIGKSRSSIITTKSCTFDMREGNPKPRYAETNMGSINSMGLPNEGYKKYAEWIPLLKNEFKKPINVSVSGLSLSDNIEMIRAFSDINEADFIELNLSCPNVIGKPQVGYDFEQSDKVLSEVSKIAKQPLGVKLPPYFDLVHMEQMADILKRHKIRFVTTINSLGNALIIDPETERPLIKPKGGFGGIGGKYVKPTALANVRKFYELLPKDVSIIGVGGITNGTDIFEHILCGARAVQAGTIFMQEGTSCFDRLKKELEDIMRRKEYDSIEDFRGQLKER